MTGHSADSEKYLLEKLRLGSSEAFEEIFKRYWHEIYTIALAKMQSHDEAEEIVQGIFASLWEKRESLLITNLSFYLRTAVRNRVLNFIRSKITQKKYWDFYKNYIPQQKETPLETVAFDDLSKAIDKAITRLPEKSRQVFTLSRFEGRSVPEIAHQLKLSCKAIEYHLTKSIKELRVYLKDYILVLALVTTQLA